MRWMLSDIDIAKRNVRRKQKLQHKHARADAEAVDQALHHLSELMRNPPSP